MERKENKVIGKYKKNELDEVFLSEMNDALTYPQEKILQSNIREEYSNIHIIGAPRSGTTLLNQIIASNLNLGHINNLIASFWKAPLFGVFLSKKLLDSKHIIPYESDYGRTSDINSPHEFGYFWNHYLEYDDFQQRSNIHADNIDWYTLRTLLFNMNIIYEKPIVFKSFLLGFHAYKAFLEMSKSIFIYVKRDFISNALSILDMRKNLLGSYNDWASIKPQQYDYLKSMDIYHQIAGQIIFLEHEYLSQLEKIPTQNKLIIKYEDFCRFPEHNLNDIKNIIKNISRYEESIVPSFPESFDPRIKFNDNDVTNKFENAREGILNDNVNLKTL